MLVVFFGLLVAPDLLLGGLGQVLEPSKPPLSMIFCVSKHALQKCSSCNKTTVFAMFSRFWNMSHTATKRIFCKALGHGAIIAARNPCWHSLSAFHYHPEARRYVRSTSAASRRDAERARFKVQVPNIASKAFLSLKSLALKAYPKVRLEIEAEAGFPHPKILPPRPARTAEPVQK